MSIALYTAEVAARMYLAGETPEHYRRTVAKHLQRQVEIATAVSRGMVAMPRLLQAALRLWPGVLPLVAERTRVAAEM